jgi:hypothetical protein
MSSKQFAVFTMIDAKRLRKAIDKSKAGLAAIEIAIVAAGVETLLGAVKAPKKPRKPYTRKAKVASADPTDAPVSKKSKAASDILA